MRAHSKNWDSLYSIHSHLKRQHDHGDDIKLYRYHTTYTIPIVRYLFNHILNEGFPYKHYDVMRSSTSTFLTTAKRGEGGRCSSPRWTPEYWTTQVIQRSNAKHCDGHYLPFFVDHG